MILWKSTLISLLTMFLFACSPYNVKVDYDKEIDTAILGELN